MEVFTLVGTVLGIIDVTTRCISSLVEIRKRFTEVHIIVESLSGQLVTVKAALSQIHALVNESLGPDEQHYQLTLDLGTAINCCNLLIRLLDVQISKLQYSDADELTFHSKVSMLLESKGTEECLTRLDRQINALNLLITVFKCRSPKEQQNLLEEKRSRKVFDHVKDDSSSLIVLCDSASFATKRTQTTTGTSKFSMNFAFDAEILGAKAYKSTLRSLMRRAQDNPPISDPKLGKRPLSRRNVQISDPSDLISTTYVGDCYELPSHRGQAHIL